MVSFNGTLSRETDGFIVRHVGNFEDLCLVGVFRMR
jgi:hypothetical protein